MFWTKNDALNSINIQVWSICQNWFWIYFTKIILFISETVTIASETRVIVSFNVFTSFTGKSETAHSVSSERC